MNHQAIPHLKSIVQISRTRDAHEAKKQSPKLDVQVRKLCNRLASETHRKAIWNTAAQLRELCKEKLSSGATKDEVCLWLNEEYRKAMSVKPLMSAPLQTRQTTCLNNEVDTMGI